MRHNPIFWMARAVGAISRRISLRVATMIHKATLAQVGAQTLIQAGVRFANPDIVQIGAECYIWRGTHASAEVGPASLTIGDGVQINRGVHLDTTGGLRIGARALISEEAVIYTHDHGLDPRAPPQPMPKSIGADVWIGMRAVILPQCTQIGAGAVIGAGSIVTMDIPENTVVAGNPARIIGKAFPTKEIAA